MSDAFAGMCDRLGLGKPEAEYQFAKDIGRKWRLDWAFVEAKIGLECDGGAWVNGRHNRASGWLKDLEKRNELAVRGWRLLTVTPRMMETGEVFNLLERALGKP